MLLNKAEIVNYLKTKDKRKLELLWRKADEVRRRHVGDDIHLRGIIEISNYCVRHCTYCGIRGDRKTIQRYRMTFQEIKSSIRKIEQLGYGTVVIQSGEDSEITPKDIIDVIRWIKSHTDLAITLSLGEQPASVFRAWKKSGADRYLLKIETTHNKLLKKIHPGEPHGSRKANTRRLKDIGFEVGSGIMIGIPGQTFEMVATDLLWFKKMDIDMIGIGPYLPHPETPLASSKPAERNQVPSDELTVNKAIALTRILCKEANLPATTALASINLESGRENALNHGANVIMPNVTPNKYRPFYEIYPSKACLKETKDMSQEFIGKQISKIGRTVGMGPGNRIRNRYTRKT